MGEPPSPGHDGWLEHFEAEMAAYVEHERRQEEEEVRLIAFSLEHEKDEAEAQTVYWCEVFERWQAEEGRCCEEELAAEAYKQAVLAKPVGQLTGAEMKWRLEDCPVATMPADEKEKES